MEHFVPVVSKHMFDLHFTQRIPTFLESGLSSDIVTIKSYDLCKQDTFNPIFKPILHFSRKCIINAHLSYLAIRLCTRHRHRQTPAHSEQVSQTGLVCVNKLGLLVCVVVTGL